MTQPANIYRYFDDYGTETFTCPSCGWTGPFDELEQEAWREVFDGSCPSCGKMLMVVGFPTAEEIRDAASAGNEEARAGLAQVEQRESLDARFDQMGLKTPEELPDLDGDELAFLWDQESKGGDQTTTIVVGDRVIWREPAFYEGWPRFKEVKEIIKARYGTRFRSLTPTARSKTYLFGDDLRAPEKISYS